MTENDLQREVQKLRYQIKLADRLEVKLDACIDLLERSNPPKGGNTDKHIRGAKTALAAWKKSREAEGAGHRCPSRTPLTGGGYVQCELAPGHECDHRAIYPAGESIVDAQWKKAATGAASGEATEPS